MVLLVTMTSGPRAGGGVSNFVSNSMQRRQNTENGQKFVMAMIWSIQWVTLIGKSGLKPNKIY